jgi:hypothetical protein
LAFGQNQLQQRSLPAEAGLDCRQSKVRRQTTFVNRDTESVVVLTPNVELVVRLWSLANDYRPKANDGFSGGADRDRTGGLLVANQALSQLSYSPLNPAIGHWLLAFS